MTKNKSLFKNISLFLCLIPMLILSLFCLVPKSEKINVSALGDQVITNFNFVGTNFTSLITSYNYNAHAYDRWYICDLTLSFGVVDGVYTAGVRGTTFNTSWNFLNFEGSTNSVHNLESAVARDNTFNVYDVGNTAHGYKIGVSHSGQLTSDIIKVKFSSYVNPSQTVIRPAPCYNTITYYDSQGEYIIFELPMYVTGGLGMNYMFEDRVYYFTTSFSDNTYYQSGYDDGYDVGVSDGKDLGYKDGYNAGVDIGYGNGYNAGVANSQDYSFLSLIGAVIDAPVSAFTSLLNFELLGVNILGFIAGLLTLALIIFIIKLCMGGK